MPALRFARHPVAPGAKPEGIYDAAFPASMPPKFRGDISSTRRQISQSWEHIENKGPGSGFFLCQSWEHTEKKYAYKKYGNS
jgi:hypothetical protein